MFKFYWNWTPMSKLIFESYLLSDWLQFPDFTRLHWARVSDVNALISWCDFILNDLSLQVDCISWSRQHRKWFAIRIRRQISTAVGLVMVHNLRSCDAAAGNENRHCHWAPLSRDVLPTIQKDPPPDFMDHDRNRYHRQWHAGRFHWVSFASVLLSFFHRHLLQEVIGTWVEIIKWFLRAVVKNEKFHCRAIAIYLLSGKA